MPIRFNQETKEFHLYNDDISYILSILPNGHVENLYYGKRVDETASYLYLRERFLRPLTAYVNDDNSNFSLQHTRQEYATYGTGDYSLPAFKIRQSDGNSLSHFVFKEFKIYDGKKSLMAYLKPIQIY